MSNSYNEVAETQEIPVEETPETKPAKKANGHAVLKIFSVLLLALFIAGLFVPMYFTLTFSAESITFSAMSSGTWLGAFAVPEGVYSNQSVFFLLLDAIKSEGGILSAPWLLFIVGSAALAVVVTIITLCVRKSAPAWLRIVGFIYLVDLLGVVYLALIRNGIVPLDLITVALVASLLVNLIDALVVGKAKGVVPFLSMILLVGGIVVAYLSGILKLAFDELYQPLIDGVIGLIGGGTFTFPTVELPLLLLYISLGVALLNIVFTFFQMGLIRSNAFTVIRYLLQLGVVAASLVMLLLKGNVQGLIYVIILKAIPLVLTVISLIAAIVDGKRKRAARAAEEETAEEEEEDVEDVEDEEAMDAVAEEETTEAPAAEEQPEETAEEPVAEEQPEAVQMSFDSVYPTAEDIEQQFEEELGGSQNGAMPLNPSYKTRTYRSTAYQEPENDHFLSILPPASKREFKKVFLSNNSPAFLPEYEVGGDNTEFFDALFLYLGKVRSVISDKLLSDIYDYVNGK